MPDIPEALRTTAIAQDGLITRAQALEAGLTRHQVDWLVGRGARWRIVLRGVYSVTSGSLTRRQQMRAALLYAGEGATLTGVTVLELYALRYAPKDPRVCLLIPMARRVRPHPALLIERTRHLPVASIRDGLPTAPLERASLDAARRSTPREAQALLAEVVQRRLTTLERVARHAADSRQPGIAPVRAAVGALLTGAASAPEADLTLLCRRSSLLPPPVMNHPLLVDGCRVVADGCWPEARLVVEVDSTEHHGFGPDAELTSRRRAALTAAGWTVLSVSPARLRDDPDDVLREIESAYLAGARRAGA